MEFKEQALRFEDTLTDSPAFRQSLADKERELNILESHIKRTVKVADKLKKRNLKNTETVNEFAEVLRDFSQLESDDPTAFKFYRKAYGFFKDMETSTALLTDQTTNMLVNPLNEYVRSSFGEWKEVKKSYEKIGHDLETASAKFAGTSLRKPDEIKMAENVLDATQSIYNFMSLDYTYQINCCTAKRRFEVMNKFVQMMFGYMSFYKQIAETIKELEPYMRDIMGHIRERQLLFHVQWPHVLHVMVPLHVFTFLFPLHIPIHCAMNSVSGARIGSTEELHERETMFDELDKDMEKRHDMVRQQQDITNRQTEQQASTKRNEVQVSTSTPLGSPGISPAISGHGPHFGAAEYSNMTSPVPIKCKRYNLADNSPFVNMRSMDSLPPVRRGAPPTYIRTNRSSPLPATISTPLGSTDMSTVLNTESSTGRGVPAYEPLPTLALTNLSPKQGNNDGDASSVMTTSNDFNTTNLIPLDKLCHSHTNPLSCTNALSKSQPITPRKISVSPMQDGSVENENTELMELSASREGYLFSRGLKKGSKSWTKHYVYIKDHKLMFQQRDGKQLVGALLQLCTVKSYVRGVDRQFVFELITPSNTILLQALSLQSKNAWIATLQSHISDALDVGLSRTTKERSPSATSTFSDVLPLTTLRIEEIKTVRGNDTCCDCGVPDTTWASINLGILLCIECSGVHRKMGTHISKVRSMTLDRWDNSLIQMMKEIGNSKFNEIYLGDVTDVDKLMRDMASDRTMRERFIRFKYIDKAFMTPSVLDGEDLNQQLFDASKETADLCVAIKAVANGGNVNWQSDFNDDWAPLHACCHWQNIPCAEFLYQNCAELNTADKQGRTPLHVAADEGHDSMVEFLLTRGAKPDVKDEEGKDPLALALAKCHPIVVTHLRLHQLEATEIQDRKNALEKRISQKREEDLRTQDDDEAVESPLMCTSNDG
eukprot:CFRG6430T1